MRVLHFSGSDRYGGANEIAYSIHRSCAEFGINSTLAVGSRQTTDPTVVPMPNQEARRSKFRTRLLLDAATRLVEAGPTSWLARNAARGLRAAAEPSRYVGLALGHEDYEHPGTWRFANRIEDLADLVHCHNLHGSYFDLRALSVLSGRVPVVLSLNDAWLLTGGCGFPFECERWLSGCGHCPQLSRISKTKVDGTAYNLRRKRVVYGKSSLHVAASSRWMMSLAEKSILAPAMVERRVIPHGVDLSVFRPGERLEARQRFQIPVDAVVVLAVGVFMKRNHMKDFATLREALFIAAGRLSDQRCFLLVLGDDGPSEHFGNAEIHYIPYIYDPAEVALYYHAADLFVHAAHAEVWGLAITQALACGVPVVATAVGGIPEQVSSATECPTTGEGASADATGVLVPPKAPADMGAAVAALIRNPDQRQTMSVNAIRAARQKFSLRDQVRTYCEWYRNLVDESLRTECLSASSLWESSQ